jgi:diadenosine tetraphosphate (Ap4A) HIT family hydrolase
VARLKAGWVILGDPQVLTGYSLLLPDPVVADLNALKGDGRSQFLADMTELGDVLMTLTGAVRINYAMLGNTEPALHAHVFPRYADEPAELRRGHPWSYDWEHAPRFDGKLHGDLLTRIRDALSARQLTL